MIGKLTKPHNCCKPCNKQAIANALLFLLMLNSSSKPSAQPALLSPLLLRSRLASCSSLTSISMLLTVASTSRTATFPPATFSTTPLASNPLPTMTNHLGVSGITVIMKSCTTAGNPPKPTIHLHAVSGCPYSPNPYPTMYATTWPNVMKMTFMVTNLPLCSAGASSAMYSGTTKLAAPTAIPTILLPTTITQTVEHAACTPAPRTNSTSATSITLFLPRLSARTDENGEIKSAKREVEAVMSDLSRELSGRLERDSPRETRVDDMTPVSSLGLDVNTTHFVSEIRMRKHTYNQTATLISPPTRSTAR